MDVHLADKHAGMVEQMARVAGQIYAPQVREVFHDDGLVALRQLLSSIRTLYKHVPCESFTDGLTVSITVLADDSRHEPGASAIVNHPQLAGAKLTRAHLLVEKDGRLRLFAEPAELSFLSKRGLVYQFRYSDLANSRIEQLRFGNRTFDIPNPTGFPSAFGVPSFADLDEALLYYGARIESPDPYLAEVWRDPRRLAFRPKPEKHMRRSLEYFLRCSLRDALIRPEQNVNETEPVDIEISWSYQGRLAWIEIKWLGHSGPEGVTTWPTSCTPYGAVQGAKQLANYLTSGSQRTLSNPCKGYLVVFDGRRARLRPTHQEIDAERGLHYRFRDIEYPSEVIDRADMAKPIRYFMPPICIPRPRRAEDH